MPEMTFAVRWPDGRQTSHYSPSLVMHDFLTVGQSYPMAEFINRTHEALDQASERVRAKYGVACTSALQSQEELRDAATGQPAGDVEVLTMQPPLPAASVTPASVPAASVPAASVPAASVPAASVPAASVPAATSKVGAR